MVTLCLTDLLYNVVRALCLCYSDIFESSDLVKKMKFSIKMMLKISLKTKNFLCFGSLAIGSTKNFGTFVKAFVRNYLGPDIIPGVQYPLNSFQKKLFSFPRFSERKKIIVPFLTSQRWSKSSLICH
jgi:hypothetical protein